MKVEVLSSSWLRLHFDNRLVFYFPQQENTPCQRQLIFLGQKLGFDQP
jgi:hypothetical protein